MGKRDNGTPAIGGTASLLRPGLLGASALLPVWLMAAGPAGAQAPNAAPGGGVVIAGKALITQSGNATIIEQASGRAAINWQSFDVGSRQSVQFQQPNAAAATLNRVIGPDPSRIAGRISANGTVVLVNQSGVIFTQGAQVNAQALAVSAADIATHAFMAGGPLHFDRPGKPGAMVVNQGTITVGQAGLAALVAPGVANSGTITATLGRVVLAGATRYTLDLYGDGLLAIDVTGQVRQLPQGPGGAPVPALVTNTGTILAQGGSVTLSASAADGLIKTLVAAGGRIAADAPGGKGGTLVLDAIGGSISIEGALSATGQTGGQAQAIASDTVAMRPGSRIDVSGAAKGGTVALGTTLARASSTATMTGQRAAQNVTVAINADIDSSAVASGQGGRVAVLSTGTTTMAGNIAARGKAGGFVEVSGGVLGLGGSIDAGATGSILIDPAVLEITHATTAGSANSDFEINQLTGGVTLQATSLLTVDGVSAPGGAATIAGAGLTSLTLDSGGALLVGAGARVNVGGALLLQAGDTSLGGAGAGGITIGDGARLGGASVTLAPGAGAITVGAASTDLARIFATGSVALGGAPAAGTLEIVPATASPVALGGTGGSGTLAVALTATSGVGGGTLRIGDSADLSLVSSIDVAGVTNLRGANLDLRTTGAVTESAGLLVQVGTLSGAAASVGLGAANVIATLATFAVAGDLRLNDAAALTAVGAVTSSSGGLTLSVTGAGNGITLGQAGAATTLTADTVALSAAGPIFESSSAALIARMLTATSTGGDVLLSGAGIGGPNRVGLLGLSSASGDFTFADAASLSVVGPVSALGGKTLTLAVAGAGNSLTLGGGPSATLIAGAVTLRAPGVIGQTADSAIVAATLGVTSSGDSVSLTGAANRIDSLVASSAVHDFALADSISLITQGLVSAGGVLTFGSPAQPIPTITVAGGLNSGAITLLAGDGGVVLGVTGAAAQLNAKAVTLSARGAISETIASAITATTLGATSTGDSVSLNGTANGIATLLASSTSGDFTLADAGALSVAGAVTAGGTLALAVTGTGNTLALGSGTTPATLTGTAVALSAPGAITGSLASAISAATLGVTSTADTVSLTGSANAVGTLSASSSAGDFTLADGAALTVAGAVVAGGTLTLAVSGTGNALALGSATTPATLTAATVALSATGAITETAASAISATTLGVTSTADAVTLTGNANSFGTLSASLAFGDLTLTDAAGLTVLGAVSAGGTLTLAVTGAGNGIAIGQGAAPAILSGGAAALSAPAAITQTGLTALIAGTLTVTSTSDSVSLTAPSNRVGTLGPSSALGSFSLTDATALTVLGTVTAGGALTLAVNGTGNGITIGQSGGSVSLIASTVSLSAPGVITEVVDTTSPATFHNAITATTLRVTSTSDAVLLTDAANQVGTLGPSSAFSGFSLTNGTALTVAGLAISCNGAFSLNVAGDVNVGGAGFAGTLAAGGDVDVTAAGAITVAAFSGAASSAILAKGSVSLGAPAIAITVASGGTVAANTAITLDAASVEIDGFVGTPATGSVALPTSAVTLAGTLATGTLLDLSNTPVSTLPATWTFQPSGALFLAGDFAADLTTFAGTIETTGGLTITGGALTQTGGILAAGTNLTIAGALTQTAGLLAAGGTVTIGSGSGAAGAVGSTGSGGSIVQSGTILAGADVVFWTAGSISLAGVVEAGGAARATAGAVAAASVAGASDPALAIDITGTVSGVGGVVLLTNGGDLTAHPGAVLAGGAGGTGDIVLLAPHGVVDLGAAIELAAIPGVNVGVTGTVTCDCAGGTLSAISSLATTLPPVAVTPSPQVLYGSLTAYPAANARVNLTVVGQSIALDGVLTAGTLSLYSLNDTTQSAGAIDAVALTGSAGLTADAGGSITLAPGLAALGSAASLGWTSPATGAVALGLSNHVLQLAGYTATGGALALTDVLDNAATPALQTLAVSGNVGDCNGSVTLNVTGNVNVGGTTFTGTLAAAGSVDVTATGAITVAPASEILATGTLALAATSAIRVASGGTVAANGDVTLHANSIAIDGVLATLAQLTISMPPGVISLGSGAEVLAANNTNALAVAASSFGGTVETGADLTVTGGALSQTGGILAAGGNLVVQGALNQTAGVIAAGGAVKIGSGTGTGTAGRPGSAGTSGAIVQQGTILAAGGDVTLWSSAAISLGGTIEAGGAARVTAGTSLDVAGTLSGVGGVFLLTNGGGLTVEGSAILAGGTAGLGNILLQAPQGAVTLRSGSAIAIAAAPSVSVALTGAVDCNCDVGTLAAASGIAPDPGFVAATPWVQTPYESLGAAPASDTRVDVAVVGQAIALQDVLVAGTLSLYSRNDTTQTSGAIDAFTLTGSAGLAAGAPLAGGLAALGWSSSSLGWTSSPGSVTLNAGNHLLTLSGYTATKGALTLADMLDNAADPALRTLAVSGIVGDCDGSVTLSVAGDLALGGTLAAAGNVDVAASGAITVAPASAILATGAVSLRGTSGPASAITVASGGTVAANGNVALDAAAIEIDGVLATRADLVIPTATDALSLGPAAALLAANNTAPLTIDLASFGGTIETGGKLAITTNTTGTLAQTGGIVAAGGSLGIAGALTQDAGALIAAGGALAIGVGSGTAGAAGSAGSSGAILQQGKILAGGGVALWSSASISLAGTIAAGSAVRATAGASLDVAGTLSGVGGVFLLANAGDLTVHDGAVLAGAAASGDIVAQAPRGTVSLASVASDPIALAAAPGVSLGLTGAVTCDCATGTLAAASGIGSGAAFTRATPSAQASGGAASTRVNVAAVGQSIVLGERLIAGTLRLFSDADITETPAGEIDAHVLIGGAGVPTGARDATVTDGLASLGWSAASLGWTSPTSASGVLGTISYPVPTSAAETIGNANRVDILQSFVTTRDFSLTDVLALNLPTKSAVRTNGTLTLASIGGLAIGGTLDNAGGLTVLMANENLLTQGAAGAALPAAITLSGTANVASGTLAVWSEGAFNATGAINAGTLTGQVGAALDAVLSPTNFRAAVVSDASVAAVDTIGNVGPLLVTGNLTLKTLGALTVNGQVTVGQGKTASLSAPVLAVADGAQVKAPGGTIDLLSPSLSVGAASLAAVRILLATDPASGSIVVSDGATLDATGGFTSDPPALKPGKAGITYPVDGSTPNSGGIYLTIGAEGSGHNGFDAAVGSGRIELGNVTIGGPLLRLALPDTSGAAATTGAIRFAGLTTLGPSTRTAVVLWLGNGTATGTLSGQQLAVFATSLSATATLNGAAGDVQGQVFPAGSQAAASAGGQGLFIPSSGRVLYEPNARLQLNGCPISSINCHIVTQLQLPPLVALPALPPLISAPLDDFDLLLPGVSDRED